MLPIIRPYDIMPIRYTKDRKMSLIDKAAKGVAKQVRKGRAVPNAKGEPDIDKMIADWSVGFQQYLTGKSTALFAENFLKLFNEEMRKSIEEDIRSLHGVQSFQRFRKKALVSFAVAYQNGAAAQLAGEKVDIKAMVLEAIASTQKDEGFPKRDAAKAEE